MTFGKNFRSKQSSSNLYQKRRPLYNEGLFANMGLGRLTTFINNGLALSEAKIVVNIWTDKEVQTFIVDLNRVDQLLKKGEDSLGETFGLYASDQGTVSFKGVSKNKKRNTPIVLLDTADFYRSFDIKITKNGFKITADDKKDDDTLTGTYGKDIIGLTDESIQKLAQKILPLFIAETRKFLLA